MRPGLLKVETKDFQLPKRDERKEEGEGRGEAKAGWGESRGGGMGLPKHCRQRRRCGHSVAGYELAATLELEGCVLTTPCFALPSSQSRTEMNIA